jgi:hypothetical protein
LEQARRRNAPTGTDALAHGSERTNIVIESSERGASTYQLTWEEVIRSVLPQTFGGGVSADGIASALASLAREKDDEAFDSRPLAFWESPTLSRSSFGTVINQMVALGLIEGVPDRPDPIRPPATIWQATPYGVREGCRLFAIKRLGDGNFD